MDKNEYLCSIQNEVNRKRVEEVLNWVEKTFPELDFRIAWNQPMYTHKDTYIIGFSVSKQHMAVSPEQKGIEVFSEAIHQAGYLHTKMLVQFPWNKPIDWSLLKEMIQYNIVDKANWTKFWR